MNMVWAIMNFTNANNTLVNYNAVASEVKTNETFDYDYKVLDIVMMSMSVLLGIIDIFGFIANLLVVVAANHEMKSNILMNNLAMADLLFIIFCIPNRIMIFVLSYWPFGNIWCKTVGYFITVANYVSIYTLVLMSLDRYLAVVHPIASMSWRRENHVISAIGFVWVTSLVLSIPTFILLGVENDPANLTKEFCVKLDMYDQTVFQVFLFLTSYVLPLMLMCIFYMSILITLWHGARVNTRRRRGRKSITRLVFVIVSVFAICWGPIQVITLMFFFDMYPITKTTVMIWMVSRFLACTNSSVNPIFYAFLNEDFRNAFRKIIYCRPRAEPNNRLRPTRTTRVANTGDIL